MLCYTLQTNATAICNYVELYIFCSSVRKKFMLSSTYFDILVAGPKMY